MEWLLREVHLCLTMCASHYKPYKQLSGRQETGWENKHSRQSIVQQTNVQGSIGTTVLFGLPLFSRQTIQGRHCSVPVSKPFKGKSNNCLNLEATVVRIQLVHYDEKMKFVAFQ